MKHKRKKIQSFRFLGYFVTTELDKYLELGIIGRIPAKYILQDMTTLTS